MNDKCPNKALFILPWAGKILKVCHQHANAMVMIANAIGSPIEVQPLSSALLLEEDCMGKNDFAKDNEPPMPDPRNAGKAPTVDLSNPVEKGGKIQE